MHAHPHTLNHHTLTQHTLLPRAFLGGKLKVFTSGTHCCNCRERFVYSTIVCDVVSVWVWCGCDVMMSSAYLAVKLPKFCVSPVNIPLLRLHLHKHLKLAIEQIVIVVETSVVYFDRNMQWSNVWFLPWTATHMHNYMIWCVLDLTLSPLWTKGLIQTHIRSNTVAKGLKRHTPPTWYTWWESGPRPFLITEGIQTSTSLGTWDSVGRQSGDNAQSHSQAKAWEWD